MKTTKPFLLTALLALLLTGCETVPVTNTANNANTNTNTNTAAAAPTKDALMTAEKQAWEAFKAKNTAFWGTFLTDDFVALGNQGRQDRAAATTQYSGSECNINSYTLSDDQMTTVSNDVAVLTYKATTDGTCNGEKLPETWSATVYVREGTAWKAAYHGSTPVVEPPASAGNSNTASGANTASSSNTASNSSTASNTTAASNSNMASNSNTASGSSTDALMAFERSQWEAWKNKNKQPFDDGLASGFVVVQGSGRSDKQQATDMWSTNNPCNISSYTLSEPQSVKLTDNISLLTYKGASQGTCNGQPVPTSWFASLIEGQGTAMKSHLLHIVAQ